MSEQTQTATIKLRTVKRGPQAYIDIPTKKGSQPAILSEPKLSTNLANLFKQSVQSLEGKEVKYQVEGGQLKRVWEVGQQWDRPEHEPNHAPRNSERNQQKQQAGRYGRNGDFDSKQGHTRKSQPGSSNTGSNDKFENPYNFVPATPRNVGHTELGDHQPVGHHRYHPDHWSGRIRVEMKLKTPLLVPDFEEEQSDGHKIYGLRLDEQGKPYLPPTTIKGPLRAAYEAITNSRLGVFAGHDERLALRAQTWDALNLIPCKVCRGSSGSLQARLLTGLTKVGPEGKPKGNGAGSLMYAAWLPRYRKYSQHSHYKKDKHESHEALRYSDGSLPKHGDQVWVKISEQTHRSCKFSYLLVEHIQRVVKSKKCPADWHEGYVFISGPNIMNKHYERVFLFPSKNLYLDIPEDVESGWQNLIQDYQQVHAKELDERKQHEPHKQHPSDYLGHEPGKTGFSTQVYNPDYATISVGDLCYAGIQTDSSDAPVKILQLFPVAISRMLYQQAPNDLLDQSLHPATCPDQLSPADRVFGWVNQNGKGSFKGQLRVGPVECEAGVDSIEKWNSESQPLAILGQPKPAQARFYAASDKQGAPLEKAADKKTAYMEKGGLRGRKFYPHQKQAELNGYWMSAQKVTKPLTERLKGRPVYREWQSRETSDQNRSITAWIKPDSRFHFDLDISNLSNVELGALLWLLGELETGYLCIGGGKPLGFGSANLKITTLDLRNGEAIAADYRAFGQRQASAGRRIGEFSQATDLIEAYKKALVDFLRPGDEFDALNMIRAFKNAARGGDLPVHYPRTDQQQGPVGEGFKWFVENEKSEKYPLPALYVDDRGLPAL